MVASPDALSQFSNPLVISSQLQVLHSSPSSPSASVQFATYVLTQAAGVLLRLPQPVIATAIIILQRHLIASAPTSAEITTQSLHSLSASSIYLSAKYSATPLAPRSVVNVYAYLTSIGSPLPFISSRQVTTSLDRPDPHTYYVSEGTYEKQRLKLFANETTLLSSLAFDIHVAHPYTLALTYLSALGTSSPDLTKRVISHLNGALLSPQLLYLTHQPNVLAVAAVYLGAREVGTKLVEENWWEVFDVDREALGFCVMAMGSLEGFAEAEGRKWEVDAVEAD